ncbi:MAG: hypothetical protein NC187_07150 [Candidatus Amulumruptor caecigallinarius]|nr:hypothetical protein [Candidatus Amulumruptor caecigallinarius]MCM1397245.1 hypothetical protein [Candidatus Amulumruptor caecigallinarius]MCM1453081.1 hypothetical protein [bacterium]
MKKLYSTLFALLAIATSAAADTETVPYSSDMTDWTMLNDGGNTVWQKWSTLSWVTQMTEADKTLTGCDNGIVCDTEEADSWAVSPAIELKPALEYVITFYLVVPDEDAPSPYIDDEDVTLTVATDNTLAAVKAGKKLFADAAFTARELTKEEAEYTPEAAGAYYFALNCKGYGAYALAATGFSITDKGSASCTTVSADGTVPAEYYDLRGIRVSRPAAGQVCIMRAGSEVKKVIIR